MTIIQESGNGILCDVSPQIPCLLNWSPWNLIALSMRRIGASKISSILLACNDRNSAYNGCSQEEKHCHSEHPICSLGRIEGQSIKY